ncbi:MAG TPA: hypothetical protein PK156_22470 [Polyangium sp.]|nr:hypothetical protein [Polyangium sp.]
MIQLNIGSTVNTGTRTIVIMGPTIPSPGTQSGHGGPDKGAGHYLLLVLFTVISIVIGVVVSVVVSNKSDARAVATAAPTTTVIVQSPTPSTPPSLTSTASTALPKAEALPGPQPKQGASKLSRLDGARDDCRTSESKKHNSANADIDSLGMKNRDLP